MNENSRRTVIRFALAAMTAAGSFAAVRWAIASPERVTELFRPISLRLCRIMSIITGVFPFSLIEVLIIAVLMAFVYSVGWLVFVLIRRRGRIKTLLQWLSHWMLFATCVAALFLGMWGLNYFGLTMERQLGLEVQPRTAEELSEVTAYLAGQANCYALRVERDENMVSAAPSFSKISKKCAEAYDAMAEKNSFFYKSGGRAKSVFNRYIMSKMGLTGIYIAMSGECNVNGDITAATLPFTTAHEMAHRMAVAPENEANFTAYLVLRDCNDDYLRYSAYYNAFVYCYNALYKADKDAAAKIAGELSAEVCSDIIAANDRYRKYEGAVRKVSQSINDTYLKTMKQGEGVQSYGEVVDLIIADYYTNVAK